jgi:hypothetical protein
MMARVSQTKVGLALSHITTGEALGRTTMSHMRIIGYLIHWAKEETNDNNSGPHPSAKKILKFENKSDKLGVQALAEQMLSTSGLTKAEVNEKVENLYKTTNLFTKRGIKRKGPSKGKGRNLVRISDSESVHSNEGGVTGDGDGDDEMFSVDDKEEAKMKKPKVLG